jgi:hypothetical protein
MQPRDSRIATRRFPTRARCLPSPEKRGVPIMAAPSDA